MNELIYRLKKLLNYLKLRLCTRLSSPVLIYQMGKVASTSVYMSLKESTNFDVFHTHRLNPENIAKVKEEHLQRGDMPPDDTRGLYLYNRLIEPRQKSTRIITLVREPVGRNISAFFQNLETFKCGEDAHNTLEIEELVRDFIYEYNHDVPLTWFDKELRVTTGTDVYRHPFPREKGYQVIDQPPFYVLVIRHDLTDEEKESCIAEFLDLDSFHITRMNVSSSKEYSETYRVFLDSIQLPKDYVGRMLSSKYARHFYSPDERKTLYQRWVGKDKA
ncbi:MAG: putative capsular polysaccharide synthesis family protein [Anaerolineales bacterium]